MGLAVSVGMLPSIRELDEEGFEHFKTHFDRLTRYLASEGHGGYVEPETVSISLPTHVSSFPYSFLHYLRRAFAHVRNGATPVPPCPDGENPAADPLVDEELTLHMSSHLCCHSDCAGYYVPIDFEDPLYPDDDWGIAGGIVGSSQRLLAELIQVAPGIGIELSDGVASDAELQRLASEDEGPLFRERIVWLTLYVNARASLDHGTAIVFH